MQGTRGRSCRRRVALRGTDAHQLGLSDFWGEWGHMPIQVGKKMLTITITKPRRSSLKEARRA